MPQGMNAVMAGQLGQIGCPVKSFLRRLDGQGRAGIAGRRKQPEGWANHAPILAQFREQPGRQNGITVFAAFALGHTNLHPGAVDVFHLQVADFAHPQPGGIGGHQQNAVFWVQALDAEQPFDLFRAVNAGPDGSFAHSRQSFLNGRSGTVQNTPVKETERADRDDHGAVGTLLITN